MSYYYGISSNSVSNFFTSSTSNSTSLYDNLGDYQSIRSGAYSRLLKNYYAQTSTSSSETSDTKRSDTTSVKDKLAATNASALKNSASELSETEFTEDKRDTATKNITNFVTSYNDMMKSIGDLDSSSKIEKKLSSMMHLAKSNSHLLKKVGITTNADGTLAVNSDTLKTADLNTLDSLFSGRNSYASRVGSYATSFYNMVLNTSTSSYSTYESNGTYNSVSTSSIIDTYV